MTIHPSGPAHVPESPRRCTPIIQLWADQQRGDASARGRPLLRRLGFTQIRERWSQPVSEPGVSCRLARFPCCRYDRAVRADLAAGQAADDETGHAAGGFRPLRARGDVLVVLLAGTLLASAARLVVAALDQGAPASRLLMDERPFVVASRVLIAITVPAFLVWFRRARINAGDRGWHQRFSRGWTFWGWIVPVANLWIPLQVMDDIWQASLPRRRPGWVAWLPAAWWTSWVLSQALALNRGAAVVLGIWAAQPPDSAPTASYRAHLPDNWPSFCVLAVAGLTLTAIIRTVSRGPLAAPARSEVSTAG